MSTNVLPELPTNLLSPRKAPEFAIRVLTPAFCRVFRGYGIAWRRDTWKMMENYAREQHDTLIQISLKHPVARACTSATSTCPVSLVLIARKI